MNSAKYSLSAIDKTAIFWYHPLSTCIPGLGELLCIILIL